MFAIASFYYNLIYIDWVHIHLNIIHISVYNTRVSTCDKDHHLIRGEYFFSPGVMYRDSTLEDRSSLARLKTGPIRSVDN